MLYMPYSAPLCRKIQGRIKNSQSSQDFAISEYFAINEVTSERFRHQRSFGEVQKQKAKLRHQRIFRHQRSHFREISPSAKFRNFKWIRATWSHLIGAEAYFQHFADSEIFGYQRNFAEVAHINIFLFSFQPFYYCFIDIFLVLERDQGFSREKHKARQLGVDSTQDFLRHHESR